jgi:hypothetical protein
MEAQDVMAKVMQTKRNTSLKKRISRSKEAEGLSRAAKRYRNKLFATRVEAQN